MRGCVAPGKAILAALVLQLAVGGTGVAQSGLAELFPTRPSGFITDVAGVIEGPAADRITAKIERLRDRTGAEVAVVTLPTIGDRAAVDVAVAIGRAWGVGADAAVGDARRNAGVVVLLVPRREGDPGSGQIFIAAGEGVEGFVTDAAAGRVRDAMRPLLARGEYAAGLEVGVDALAALIARGMGVVDSTLAPPVERESVLPIFVALIIIAIVIIFVVVAVARSAGGSGGPRPPRSRWGGMRHGSWGGLGGGGFGGGGGGGFGGFGGGGGFSGGGAGGRF